MHWVLIAALVGATGQDARPSPVSTTPRPATQPVAVVNGTPLFGDRLEAATSALLPYESFHRNVSAEKLTELRQQALGRLVDDELQYQDAVARGLTVSPAAVDVAFKEAAARYPSRQALVQALAAMGATVNDLRRELRRTLLIRRAYETRVTARCAVTEADARAYFAQHPERFVEPERLQVQAITIGVAPSAGAAAWTAARAKADAVRTLLVEGAGFEETARRYSTDPSAAKGGDMGAVHRGSLSPQFETVVATLAVGEISPVVETIYGYHVIRVTEVLPARPRGFADVGARLQQDLTVERCASTRDGWLAGLRATAAISYPQ